MKLSRGWKVFLVLLISVVAGSVIIYLNNKYGQRGPLVIEGLVIEGKTIYPTYNWSIPGDKNAVKVADLMDNSNVRFLLTHKSFSEGYELEECIRDDELGQEFVNWEVIFYGNFYSPLEFADENGEFIGVRIIPGLEPPNWRECTGRYLVPVSEVVPANKGVVYCLKKQKEYTFKASRPISKANLNCYISYYKEAELKRPGQVMLWEGRYVFNWMFHYGESESDDKHGLGRARIVESTDDDPAVFKVLQSSSIFTDYYYRKADYIVLNFWAKKELQIELVRD